MKIGILGAFYNCAKDVKEVLSPFMGRGFKFSVCNIQFDHFSTPPDSETYDALMATPGETICVSVSPVPMKEHEARSMAMNYLLERDVDYVWILDGDEFYTTKEVDNIVEFLSQQSAWSEQYYSISFKNYVFDGKSWIHGFRPPRIFSNRVRGGLARFYWDNDVVYKDGSVYSTLNETKIPESVAHVRHMTWLHSNGKEKVEYQLKHFGACSYKWDDKENELKFDETFYGRQNKEIPELHYD